MKHADDGIFNPNGECNTKVQRTATKYTLDIEGGAYERSMLNNMPVCIIMLLSFFRIAEGGI